MISLLPWAKKKKEKYMQVHVNVNVRAAMLIILDILYVSENSVFVDIPKMIYKFLALCKHIT